MLTSTPLGHCSVDRCNVAVRGLRQCVHSLLLLAGLLLAGCSNDLTHSEVNRIVAQDPRATGITPIAAEGISETSASEAIAKTRIGEDVFNLKFRRYDKNWRWEFVETRGGGWIAAGELLDQLQEKQRLKRVEEWAATNMGTYGQTIAVMDRYSDDMPHNIDWGFSFSSWMRMRKAMADVWKSLGEPSSRVTEEERRRIRQDIENADKPAFDAWGNEILMHFESGKLQATFVSIGPDKKQDTADDVVCLVSGREEWEPSLGRRRWVYTKTWHLPEGLKPAIDRSVKEESDRRATYARVVQ